MPERIDHRSEGRQSMTAAHMSARAGRHEQRWWRRWFFIFEPRDLWIGVFVSPEKYDEDSGDFVQRTYFALIPTVVLVRQVWREGV
jgi:hypothetical protein